jgi:hypothetical protein
LPKANTERIFVFMVTLRCAKCGLEIVPGTSFCRSCGAPVESQPDSTERKTALLGERAEPRKTQRFESRTTADDGQAIRSYRPVTPVFVSQQSPAKPSRRGLLIVGLILMLLVCASALVGVIKRTRHSARSTRMAQQLIYPGARTVINVGGENGGVLQMETTDPIDKVSDWYAATLKPTNTLQVTTATVIMKNDQVTATMAGTDQGTTIVIKQVTP